MKLVVYSNYKVQIQDYTNRIEISDNATKVVVDPRLIWINRIDFDPSQHDLTEFTNTDADPFVRQSDIPTPTPEFIPSEHDLDEFKNENADPFAHVSDIEDYSLVNEFESLEEATTIETDDKLMINRLVGGVPTLYKITNENFNPDASTTQRGLVNIGTQTFSGNKIIVGESSTIGDAFDVKNSASTNLLTVLNSGNIGIGAITPSYPLDIYNGTGGFFALNLQSNNDYYRPGIRMQALRPVASGIAFSMFDLYIGNVESNLTHAAQIGVFGLIVNNPSKSTVTYLYMGSEPSVSYDNNTFRLYPNKTAYFAGRVGIGTVSPTAKISIVGSGSTSSTSSFEIKNSSGTKLFEILDDGSVRINVAGRVGIGTVSPTAKISIVGSGSTSSTSSFDIKNSSGTKLFEILDDGSVRINVAGNGISLTTPDGLHKYKIAIDNSGNLTSTLI
jgi:hypothetical protein